MKRWRVEKFRWLHVNCLYVLDEKLQRISTNTRERWKVKQTRNIIQCWKNYNKLNRVVSRSLNIFFSLLWQLFWRCFLLPYRVSYIPSLFIHSKIVIWDKIELQHAMDFHELGSSATQNDGGECLVDKTNYGSLCSFSSLKNTKEIENLSSKWWFIDWKEKAFNVRSKSSFEKFSCKQNQGMLLLSTRHWSYYYYRIDFPRIEEKNIMYVHNTSTISRVHLKRVYMIPSVNRKLR